MWVFDNRNAIRYAFTIEHSMIQSFRDRETEKLFQEGIAKGYGSWSRVAMRKLTMLHAATTLIDLKVPPNNKLEKLKGNRLGQYSIRINDQWRICFIWKDGNAYNVEIEDYH